MNFEKAIWIGGVARSGTSWMGQIFRSCPMIRYRFQPLFSYEHKGAIDEDSTADEMRNFLNRLWESETDFLCQKSKVQNGDYPDFPDSSTQTILTFKENRYQSVIEPFLSRLPESHLIALIRHPCAVLNSWRKNDREFPPNAKFEDEWRFGECKNQGTEDYFGFYKWREVANLYLDLADKYPERVALVHYDQFVVNPVRETRKIFDQLELPWERSTKEFLAKSQSRHDESYYSVFKHPSVAKAWTTELDGAIVNEIHDMLGGTRLERFLFRG